VERSISGHADDDHVLFGSGAPAPSADHGSSSNYVPGQRRRADRHRPVRRPRRARRRLLRLLAILIIVAVVGASWFIVKQVSNHFRVADYSGSGQGFVQVAVQTGDTASDVGATLVKAGVVKSARAFVNAAVKSGKSSDIQAGTYRLRLHSSGAAAMAGILDPANQVDHKVTIPEGFTYKQVLQQITDKTGISLADLNKAAADLSNLGIPDGISTKSVEGLLFPATYSFDPNTTASSALQAMITKFDSEYVSLGVPAKAKAISLSPYQVLIIASISEAEAKFDADRAKVARVIINRIAIKRPLQVDATSAYVAKLEGKDPTKIIYSKINSPFNTYTHSGLPPTPIGNPGEAAINAALNPPAGDWLYYVNVDAAGHLGFFSDETDFLNAVATCKAKNWGCG
jgi:UPF0755 protein